MLKATVILVAILAGCQLGLVGTAQINEYHMKISSI